MNPKPLPELFDPEPVRAPWTVVWTPGEPAPHTLVSEYGENPTEQVLRLEHLGGVRWAEAFRGCCPICAAALQRARVQFLLQAHSETARALFGIALPPRPHGYGWPWVLHEYCARLGWPWGAAARTEALRRNVLPGHMSAGDLRDCLALGEKLRADLSVPAVRQRIDELHAWAQCPVKTKEVLLSVVWGWGNRGEEEEPIDAHLPWGRMRYRELELTIPAPPEEPRVRDRLRVEGQVPRRFDRILLEGPGWRSRKRLPSTPPGSYLIDVSGSMGWSPQDLDWVLRRAPGATVAYYAAGYRSGTLMVCARDGYRAEHFPSLGGANVIDGPALLWLAEQPGPRIWVSDGEVTGVLDYPTDALIREAARITKTYAIRRVEKKDLLAELRSARVEAKP